MSKANRKVGQSYRREARKQMEGYQQQLDGYLHNLQSCLKSRPRWCPRFIWRAFVGIAFDYKKFEDLMNNPR
jgi:hypothetical protein